MSWLIVTHHVTSTVLVALCAWLAHVNAASHTRFGRLIACGFACVALFLALTAFGRGRHVSPTLIDWLLIASKCAFIYLFSLLAIRREFIEKRMRR